MGLFKSKKKADEIPKLVCKPGESESYKCIFLASYRGLPVDIEWNVSTMDDDKLSESMHMGSLSQFPCLKDGDLVVTGLRGVMTYLNIKGQAHTIHPRKARVLAMQQYWIQVLMENFEPLLGEISSNKSEIKNVLGALNNILQDNKYIVGEFSLADIHWAGVCKMLEENGQNDVINDFESIKAWLEIMKNEISSYDADSKKFAA